jgi:hypothetical protein
MDMLLLSLHLIFYETMMIVHWLIFMTTLTRVNRHVVTTYQLCRGLHHKIACCYEVQKIARDT